MFFVKNWTIFDPPLFRWIFRSVAAMDQNKYHAMFENAHFKYCFKLKIIILN